MSVVEAFLQIISRFENEEKQTHFIRVRFGGLVIDVMGVIEAFLIIFVSATAGDRATLQSYLGGVHRILILDVVGVVEAFLIVFVTRQHEWENDGTLTSTSLLASLAAS